MKYIGGILAAGDGTRLDYDGPKALYPVVGTPMVFYPARQLKYWGMDKIILSVKDSDLDAFCSVIDGSDDTFWLWVGSTSVHDTNFCEDFIDLCMYMKKFDADIGVIMFADFFTAECMNDYFLELMTGDIIEKGNTISCLGDMSATLSGDWEERHGGESIVVRDCEEDWRWGILGCCQVHLDAFDPEDLDYLRDRDSFKPILQHFNRLTELSFVAGPDYWIDLGTRDRIEQVRDYYETIVHPTLEYWEQE